MERIQCAVSGVILAAGRSSRMGRDKLSLPFNGKPMLQHVVDAARKSRLKKITVVIPGASELENAVDFSGCDVVRLVRRDLGQSASLQAGLRNVMNDSDGCMILLGDQPLITPAAIDMLAGAFAQQPECWVAPVQEGMRGNPITIPSAWYQKIFEIEGDIGARQLLASAGLPLRLVRIHEIGPFIDVDTTLQYSRLLDKYESKSA